MEREMKIRGLLMDPSNNSPIVILKEVSGDLMLPIWVGPFEANAIASEIEKISPQRPMTHDLLRNLIIQFGGVVSKVIITELRDNTFYAVIELSFDGESVFLDSRPSDAIALSLRVDCPIYVKEEVIESSQKNEKSGFDREDNMDDEFDWPEDIGDVNDYKM
jgi:uncharacterized protein